MFTNNVVSSLTDITFNPNINTTVTGPVTGPGTIIIELPSYDVGWVPVSNTIACKIGTTTFPCSKYNSADWIVIPITAATTLTTTTTITLQNLLVPRYSTTTQKGPTFRFISGATNQETIRHLESQFLTSSVPAFKSATLSASKMSIQAVDVQYTFQFASNNDVPAGSKLVVIFPADYNLLSSNPVITFSTPDLLPISSTKHVTFTSSYNEIVVTNFKTVPAGNSMTVIVNGVRNPSDSSTSTGWQGQILFQDGVMVSQTNFAQFTYLAASSATSLSLDSVTAFPVNAGIDADYIIEFTPVTPIPPYGEIHITFPSANYKVLPTPPQCSIKGALTTFSSCALSGSTYIIVLDTAYTSGQLSVTIQGVTNPSTAVTTDSFTVSTYYDSSMLDFTDLTGLITAPTVTIVKAPDSIKMLDFKFDPKNEGESSTYLFSFVPTATLTAEMTILIIFPDVYDNVLGTNTDCSITSGLSGIIVCNVNRKIVSIQGFQDYTPDSSNPIGLAIYGVINPNYAINTDSGQFQIATLSPIDGYYTDFNPAVGTVEPLSAPGWSILWSITPANLYARTSSNYVFNFTTFNSIPQKDLGGTVLITLPAEFEINDQTLTCESSTEDYATDVSCYITRNNIYITGNTAAYNGNLEITVKGITNPVYEGDTKDIQIKVYDSFGSRVLERTYQNLDPIAFSYKFPGPLITINGDDAIVIKRGTQSDIMLFTLDYPSALNLTFNPVGSDFTIIPFDINLYLGDIYTEFKISVPEETPLGTYYIEWQTFGELIPAYYTPLRRTTIQIVSNESITILPLHLTLPLY